MGIKALSEELAVVLEEGTSAAPCCGDLSEMIRRLARESGLQEDALLEASKCDEGCRKKYMDKGGSFKGGSGDEFENCKKMFKECCTGVKDPEALCAYIGRRAGRI